MPTAQEQELLDAEIALMEQRERVAEMRRALPGRAIDDYVVRTEAGRAVPLSSLFSAPDRTLVLYQFMFGKAQTKPCPMCTMWTDASAGVARHLLQRVDFGVIVAGDPTDLRRFGDERGWSRALQIFSAGDSSMKADLGFEGKDGSQESGVTVFRLGADRTPHLQYARSAVFGPDLWRGIDLLCPTWHYLDLTPEGRGDWFASLDY